MSGSINKLGALPTLYAATQDIPGGCYVGPGGIGGVKGYPKIGTASKTARDEELAQRLWSVSEQLTDTALPLPA